MATSQDTGSLGNLTLDEERKLQQAWIHVLRLCGNENLDAVTKTSTPDRSSEFLKHLDEKDPEAFRKHIWDAVRTENPDSMLLRFLRARKWDVEKAVIMCLSTLNWRDQVNIDKEIVLEGEAVAFKETPTEDDKGFVSQYRSGKSYVRGADKESRPIYVVKVRLHDPSLQSSKSMETYVLHNIESIRLLVRSPNDKACLIFDMTGFGLKNMDFHVVKFLAEVFEARYPETLGVVLVHNAPFIFWGVWSIIKGWLDPVIRSKINFTRSSADLERFISKDNLQKCYGGNDTWEYKYLEPVVGENARLQDEEKRAKVQEERQALTKEFDQETVEWVALDPASTEAKEKNAKRMETAKQLHSNYWVLDPYLRSRTFYHRAGILNDSGDVDFKAAGRESVPVKMAPVVVPVEVAPVEAAS